MVIGRYDTEKKNEYVLSFPFQIIYDIHPGYTAVGNARITDQMHSKRYGRGAVPESIIYNIHAYVHIILLLMKPKSNPAGQNKHVRQCI